MELIAKDLGGGWHYDGGETYWCLDKDKKPVGKIKVEYVPDPITLWQSKCDSAGVTKDSELGQRLKPNQVVFKLWEHKYANFDT